MDDLRPEPESPANGPLAYILGKVYAYSYRLSEFSHLQQKVYDGFFFTWGDILLTLGFLFFRAFTMCAIMEGRTSDVVMFC
jgi:hypothetical protein